MKNSKYLESSKDVLGGTLVFKGTRVPVDTVIKYLSLGWSWEQITTEVFPQLEKWEKENNTLYKGFP